MHVSQWLQAPTTLDGAPVERDRDSLVVLAFKTAVAVLTKRQGAAMSSWQYGSLTYHRVLIHHPFAPMLDSAGRAIYEVGPLPIGGDGNAPWVTAGLNDVQASGASFRVVLDLADFDRSVATNTPGQSGDPRSAHYRDLFPKWVAGTYFPLAYSAGAIARERESVTTIRP
jgi:penicillin amidase